MSNAVTNALSGAGAGFAIATVVSGIAIGFLAPKSDAAGKVGAFSAGVGAIGGAVLGLVVTGAPARKEEPQGEEKTTESATEGEVWTSWRNFVVSRKVRESEEITSFYLQPEDGGSLPDFKPGQFLTIQVTIPEESKPVIRTYSLSDYPDPLGYYRLSIKREPSPKGLDVPPGLVSNFMHDRLEEGTVIPAKPPAGKFVLDLAQKHPAVLISNGVGITPMLAMAKAAAKFSRDRHIWFLHGARNSDYHACREEVLSLQERYPNLHVHFRYSRPKPEDEGLHHSQGYVDTEFVQTVVAPEIEAAYGKVEADYFLCGSPPFLESLREGLSAWGVESDRVFFEAFGGKMPAKKEATASATAGAEVVFDRSGKTANWTPDSGTLLEFAEANGLEPDYSCRAGVCLTCMCEIKEGEVEYETPPVGTPDEGSVLICISKPKTEKVVLDL